MKSYKTEKELYQDNQTNLYLLERGIANKKITLDEIGNAVPGMLHLNQSENLGLTYFNDWAKNRFEKTVTEVQKAGMEFMFSLFEAGTAHLFNKSLKAFLNKQDSFSTHGFFQKFRFNPETNYEWFYTSSKLLEEGNSVCSFSAPVGEMTLTNNKLISVLEDNLYLRKHFCKLNFLTKREKEIIQLVANGKTTRQIADQLFVSHHTISTHRKNIGRKLDLKTITDWERFANAFEL